MKLLLLRKSNLFFLMMVVMTIIGSCTKGGELKSTNGTIYLITGNADPQQVVPQGSGTGSATFSGWQDDGLNVLTFTLTWNTLFSGTDVVTGINFYAPADAGMNGTLIRSVAFSSNSPTGTINLGLGGYSGLSETERSSLYSGKCYYVITSVKAPAGLVRGQLTAKVR